MTTLNYEELLNINKKLTDENKILNTQIISYKQKLSNNCNIIKSLKGKIKELKRDNVELHKQISDLIDLRDELEITISNYEMKNECGCEFDNIKNKINNYKLISFPMETGGKDDE